MVLLMMTGMSLLPCAVVLYYQLINLKPLSEPSTQQRMSEAEIAAKAIGYWEKRSLTCPSEESVLCTKGLLKAQERLIILTGDFVPDEAKEIYSKRSVIETLPPNVASLDLARKSKL